MRHIFIIYVTPYPYLLFLSTRLLIDEICKNLDYPQGKWERTPTDTVLSSSAMGPVEVVVNEIVKVTR